MNRNEFFRFRREKGYTQEMMAEYLKMATNTYIFKERGKADFTLTEAARVADLFGITIDHFYQMLNSWEVDF